MSSIRYYTRMRQRLERVIGELQYAGLDRDCKDALEYLEHNELGIAFELLVCQAFEHEIKISKELKDELNAIGETLGPRANLCGNLDELVT